MIILEWLGNVFRWLLGAVLPMFFRPLAPTALAWFLHLVLVIALTVGCYIAQHHNVLRLNEILTKGPRELWPYWLALLFLLAYALMWAAARLWALLAPNQLTTDFPDLDEAWAKVTDALAKAGIGLSDTPLFLVFGNLPNNGFDNFFRSLPHGLTVAGAPGSGSELQVYANRDGIYLTLPGASLLGVQERGGLGTYSDDGAGGSVYQSVGVNQSIGAGMGASIGGMGASIGGMGASIGGSIAGGSIGGIGGPLQEIQKIIRKANAEKRELTEAENQLIRKLSGSAPESPARSEKRAGGFVNNVLQNPDLVDLASARLAHVCGLIAAARWPLCPINGAILAVPITAAEKDEAAQQWGLVARQDLAVAELVLKLHFPVFTIVGGVEDLAGGHVFFERFPVEMRRKRLGKSFPLNPELRVETSTEAVESTVGWVFNNLLPYWAFKLTRVDGDANSDTRDNAGLVRFLSEVRRRGPYLSRLVSRAVVLYSDQKPLFGGCYLTVFLRNEPGEAKFARAFFEKVEETQGAVCWTDEAFAEDASYRRTAMLGHLALGAILLGTLALAGYVAYQKGLIGKDKSKPLVRAGDARTSGPE